MLKKERLQTVLALALPIIGGMVSQNVMNLVDTAMVGSLGAAALAGVGMASFANFVSVAFLTGLSSGVQAMAARRKGQARLTEMAVPLNGGLLLAAGLGIPTAIVLILAAPYLFPFLVDDPDVIAVGVEYWQVRLVAVPAVAMNFAFRGYFNGINLSRLYLRTLLVMHAANLFLNYVLIFGKLGFPEMGATGAAVGTMVATYLGTVTYVILALLHARPAGFLRGVPDRATFGTMLRQSVPMGLQQLFFAAGMTALFWIVGRVGTVELAATNILINITLVGILPGLALGLAAASLVGQSLGRADPADARQWGWDVVKIGIVILTVIGLPMIVAPGAILYVFSPDDPSVVAAGEWPLRIVGLGLWVDAIGMVLLNALLGAGASRQVAKISIGLQWLAFLPAAYLVGPVMGLGLTGIWLAQAIYRTAQAGIFAAVWRGESWTSIKV